MPPKPTPPRSKIPTSADGDIFGFLFNGQGAQKVGMTASELKLPAVHELYDTANRVLGYDLRTIVTEGPQTKLNDTRHCQPALLVAG